MLLRLLTTDDLMDFFVLAEFGVFTEQEYNIYILDSDLTIDNLDTLDLMVARVMRDSP